VREFSLSPCSGCNCANLVSIEKWVSNLLSGEDSDLGSARKNMDKRLGNLQQATEFAILGNTEELQKMSLELNDNQQLHTKMLQRQMAVLDIIQDRTKSIQDDMSKLLNIINNQKKGNENHPSVAQNNKPPSANKVRNNLPVIEGEIQEYHILKETMVPDTCSWLFSELAWEAWVSSKDSSSPRILAITGHPGAGKSHIAAAVYDKLASEVADDASRQNCAAHFYFREQHGSLSEFSSAIVTAINQIVEYSAPVCEKINIEFMRDQEDNWNWWTDPAFARVLVKHLLVPTFHETSEAHMFLVLDGVDELEETERQKFYEFLQIITEQKLRISVVFTSRPEILSDIASSARVANIEVEKTKQVADIKTLVWHRINSGASLRKFSRYVQQRIGDKVEQAAPSKKNHFLMCNWINEFVH
jgi:Cdc6-like AAA superfamily ATPase